MRIYYDNVDKVYVTRITKWDDENVIWVKQLNNNDEYAIGRWDYNGVHFTKRIKRMNKKNKDLDVIGALYG